MRLADELARLPGVVQMRGYQRSYLGGDLMAGLLVAALAVPQALGYAAVAGVGVQVGLYTLPPALLGYALFGSSPVLFVGPVSTVTVLSGTIVKQLSGGDAERAAALTAALAIVAGVVLLTAGLARIGWVAQFLSAPIVTGFVAGLVVLIIVGEIPGLLGLPTPTGALLDRLWGLLSTIGQAHPTTMMIGIIALAVLFLGGRFAPRAPWSLVVLAGGIAVSHYTGLAEHGARVVGAVPSGLPLPRIPAISLSDLGSLITGGVAVAGVGIAEGLAAGRTFAATKSSSPVKLHDDTELVANGVADIASGVFGGMGVAGSLSKTAANSRAGARTQLSGVFAAVTVLLVLLFATGLLSDLPKAVLSAIVIHAVWGLVHPHEFLRFAEVRLNDGVAAVVAFGGVLLLGPLNGLVLAIGQSLAGLVYRSMQVHIDEMGKVPGEKAAWGAVANDERRRLVPRVCVLRPDGPIFWANASSVFERIRAGVQARPDAAAVVLDLEASNQMDTTTSEQLSNLLRDLRERGVDLFLVRVFGNVRAVLERAGVIEELGDDHVWHSIAAGVKAAKRCPAMAAALAGASEADAQAGEDSDDEDDSDEGEHIASRWTPRDALDAVIGVVRRG
jgi:high affinity sulfate transporter 1